MDPILPLRNQVVIASKGVGFQFDRNMSGTLKQAGLQLRHVQPSSMAA
jgi:hypothetical protein